MAEYVDAQQSLRDYLSDKDDVLIQFRIAFTDMSGHKCDTIFGYARWLGGELRPEDGDSYSLDYVVKWELYEDMVIAWEEAVSWEWVEINQ